MPGPTEAKTRKELIDPALKRAGWDVADPNRVGLEIPVDGFDPMAWQILHQKLARLRADGGVTYDLETPKGVSDYALYRPNGEIMAVVEAKRTSTDPRLAQAQAEFYISEIAKRQSFAPFAFMTNGERIYFLEDLTGFRKPVRSDLVAFIAEDVSRLPDYVFEDPSRAALARLCLTPQMRTATASQLSAVIDALAGEMRNRRERPNPFIVLDLPDYVDQRGYILLMGGTERVYVEEYRRRVDQRILDLVDTNPTLQAIGRGEPVSDLALIELERALHQGLGAPGLELSEENIRKAFAIRVGSLLEFLRRLLDLDGLPDYGDIVQRQFSEYIAAHPFSADQIRFLRAVQNVFTRKRRLQPADLYDPPLTAFGQDAVERWFAPEQVTEMLAFAEGLAI